MTAPNKLDTNLPGFMRICSILSERGDSKGKIRGWKHSHNLQWNCLFTFEVILTFVKNGKLANYEIKRLPNSRDDCLPLLYLSDFPLTRVNMAAGNSNNTCMSTYYGTKYSLVSFIPKISPTPTFTSGMWPRRLLILFPACNSYFFYILLPPCYGMLPIPPSTDKTTVYFR